MLLRSIDILVAFAPTANCGLLDRAQIQEELEGLLSRRVDIISKRANDRSSNPIRPPEILSTAQTIGIQITAIAFQCTRIQIPTCVGVFLYVLARA
ncbi:hypothetical protein QUB56_14575 [Microcoleus sp. AR_TQ3_B6]|uniref:hypothetical protein n=1 Tax=Microcoleus sp. AR_TQ3_B6 TaxID=3055284 RepID=UPI002FD3F546